MAAARSGNRLYVPSGRSGAFRLGPRRRVRGTRPLQFEDEIVMVEWFSRQSWARMLAIVLGALSLLDMPFGTALGIYSLWVLLAAKSEEEYRQITGEVAVN